MASHLRVRLLHGDCIDRLGDLEDGIISALITDPPYDLTSTSRGGSPRTNDPETPFGRTRLGSHDQTRKSGGFMGRVWDATGIAFDPDFWDLVLRKLRPGGVVKAFGGTRTYHRMVRAMRRAGLVDVKLRSWIYGCLDASSEILTQSGWKPGIEVSEGEIVACWDPDTEAVMLLPIEEKIVAPYDGDLVRFVNDNTDQRLTPNHRVYKRHRIRRQRNGVRVTTREDRWTVMEAGEINRWNTLNLPLAGYHDGPGLEGEIRYAELLAWVWTEGGFDNHGTGIRVYQSTRVDGSGLEFVKEIHALMEEMVPDHKHYVRPRFYRGLPYDEHMWFFAGEMAARVRADLPDKHPPYGLLWRMSLEEKEAFLHASLRGDGTPAAKTFYQKDDADREWFQVLAHVIGWQARDNPREASVSLHENPQTQLVQRHLKRDRERYVGDVWCVRVPTGAFLARHNGRVFITGNSGFPKSTNISKQIDRRAKAERQVVGYSRGVGGENLNDVLAGKDPRIYTGPGGSLGAYGVGIRQVPVQVPVTVPATEEAKLWEGYGTALKPAWEPIVVARRPE